MPTPASKIKDVFLDAVELATAPERQAFLDRACGGDAALRREVEDLLRHHNQLGSFIDPSWHSPPTTDQSDREEPGW